MCCVMSLHHRVCVGVLCALQLSSMDVAASFIVEPRKRLRDSVVAFVTNAKAGGYRAQRALGLLIDLVSTPGATNVMRDLGAINAAAALLKKKNTDMRTRTLASSLVTLLTDVPIVTTHAEMDSSMHTHTCRNDSSQRLGIR